jgi:nucleoside-diphosphate-sugar epimerase
LWAVTDARDAARAFRLALENDSIRHEVLLINGDDTCSQEATPVLLQQYYPNVPMRRHLKGFDTLTSHDRATRMLGFRPQYSWRQGEFRDWLDRDTPRPLTDGG